MTLLQTILNNHPKTHSAEAIAMAKVIVAMLSTVETLVFNDYVAAVVGKEREEGRLPHIELRLPYDNFWVEWPAVTDGGFPIREGFLVASIDGEKMALYALSSPLYKNAWAPVFGGLLSYTKLPCVKFEGIHICLQNPEMAPIAPITVEESIRDLVQTLFVLTVPRMSHTVAVTPSPTVNKARLKKGKHPIIEYKKVVVDLMKPVKASPYNHNVPSGVINHKRLHQVQGHIRTLIGATPQGNPRHTWVSPHWRGDPHLGVIIHDKTIRT